MREPKNTLIINGKSSEIFYRKSKAQKAKKFNLYTIEMLNILEALLKGCDRDLVYNEGITTLNYITSWDEKELKVKRLSNKIIRLRYELPQSCILTYRPLGKYEEWRYSVIKTKENIKALKNLRQKILNEITNSNQNQTPTKVRDT